MFGGGRRRDLARGFKRLSASHIIERRKLVWSCNGCGLISEIAPTQCKGCGRLDFTRWDSKAEQRRWAELELWQKIGHVVDLRRQVRFELFAWRDGEKVKVGEYVADFVYVKDGETIVEDAKGEAITDLAAWKVRHMAAQGTPVKLKKMA